MPSLVKTAAAFAVLALGSAPAVAGPVTGDWFALSRLAGHSYSSGNNVLKFLQKPGDTFLIYDSEIGGGRLGFEAFALKRTSLTTAEMRDDHTNRVIATVTLASDGWVETWTYKGSGRAVIYRFDGKVLWRTVETLQDGQVTERKAEAFRRV